MDFGPENKTRSRLPSDKKFPSSRRKLKTVDEERCYVVENLTIEVGTGLIVPRGGKVVDRTWEDG